MRDLKPHVMRDNRESRHAIQDRLGIPRSDSWMIHFPHTSSENGALWFADTCEYVRTSISVWYRDGLNGLSALHAERFPRA